MMFTKVATCLLGLLFLLPLVATFWSMARTGEEVEAKLQESVDEKVREMKVQQLLGAQGPPAGMVMTSVRVTRHSSLPFLPPKLWAPFTHRWVGVMGLTFLGIVVVLWMFCSFVPGIQAQGSHTSTPDFSSDAPDKGRIILTDDLNGWNNKKSE